MMATPQDIIEAFEAKDSHEDTPAYKAIRKAIKSYVVHRHEYYTIVELAKSLEIPSAIVAQVLTPSQLAATNSKPSIPNVFIYPEGNQ